MTYRFLQCRKDNATMTREEITTFLDSSEHITMDNTDQHIFDHITEGRGLNNRTTGPIAIEAMFDLYRAGIMAGRLKTVMKERDSDEVLDSEIDIGEIIELVKADKDEDKTNAYIAIADYVKRALDEVYIKGYMRAVHDET